MKLFLFYLVMNNCGNKNKVAKSWFQHLNTNFSSYSTANRYEILGFFLIINIIIIVFMFMSYSCFFELRPMYFLCLQFWLEIFQCITQAQRAEGVSYAQLFLESFFGEHGAASGLSVSRYTYPEISHNYGYGKRLMMPCLEALKMNFIKRSNHYTAFQQYHDYQEGEVSIRQWFLSRKEIKISELLSFYDLVRRDTLFLSVESNEKAFRRWEHQFFYFIRYSDLLHWSLEAEDPVTWAITEIANQKNVDPSALLKWSPQEFPTIIEKVYIPPELFKQVDESNVEEFFDFPLLAFDLESEDSAVIAALNDKSIQEEMISQFLILERQYINSKTPTFMTFWSHVESEYRQYCTMRYQDSVAGLSGVDLPPRLHREHMASFIAKGGSHPYLRFKYSTYLYKYGTDSPLYQGRDAYFRYNSFFLSYVPKNKAVEDLCIYCSEIPDEDIHLFVGPGHCKFRAIFGNKWVYFVKSMNPFFIQSVSGREEAEFNIAHWYAGRDFWDRPQRFSFNRWRYFGLFYYYPSLMQNCENYAAYKNQMSIVLPPRPLNYPIFHDCCGFGGSHKEAPRFFYDPRTHGTYVCLADAQRNFVSIRLWEFNKLELAPIKKALMDEFGLLSLDNPTYDLKYFQNYYWVRVDSAYIADPQKYPLEFKLADLRTGYYNLSDQVQDHPEMPWLVNIEEQRINYEYQRKHWWPFLKNICVNCINFTWNFKDLSHSMQQDRVPLHLYNFESFACNFVSYLKTAPRDTREGLKTMYGAIYDYCLLLKAEMFWYQREPNTTSVTLETLILMLSEYKKEYNITAEDRQNYIENLLSNDAMKYQDLQQINKEAVNFIEKSNLKFNLDEFAVLSESLERPVFEPKVESDIIPNQELKFNRAEVQLMVDVQVQFLSTDPEPEIEPEPKPEPVAVPKPEPEPKPKPINWAKKLKKWRARGII